MTPPGEHALWDQLGQNQHRRYNPLTAEWVLVSPHRVQRPWQGRSEPAAAPAVVEYDPTCYLCPGNERATGATNPVYTGPIAFMNDYAALRSNAAHFNYHHDDLIVAQSEYGLCKVICYAPQHHLHIGTMADSDVVDVISLWADETVTIGRDRHLQHVQIFENRGQMMGASNPHPHGQLWANETIPTIARRKAEQQQRYAASHHTRLLLDYVAQEERLGQRIICRNEHFVWLVPFWAVWPYETMIVATRAHATIDELNALEQRALAHLLKRAIQTYDRIFDCPFPYSMGIHQAPLSDQYRAGWQLHIGFYPPLLRSATVRKFMVGYELCAMPQRDMTAEQAAATLQKLS